MAADAKAKGRIASGADIVNLAAGEPDFPTPAAAAEAGKQAIADGLTKYGPAAGMTTLRHEIAAQTGVRTSTDVLPENVIVTMGGKHALMGAFRAVLNPDDEVVLTTPCWASTPDMVTLAGGRPVRVPTSSSTQFLPTAAQLEQAVTENTAALCLCSPNNPTGAGWPRALIEAAVDLAVRHDLVIISDEVYRTLPFDDFQHVSPYELAPERTVIIDSVSKAFAMTGWRVGWAVAPPAIIAAMITLQSQTTSGVATINQVAALSALRGDPSTTELMRSAYQRRMQLVTMRLDGIAGIVCTRPRGAFYVFPDVSALYGMVTPQGRAIRGSMDLQDHLLDAGVAVVAGAPFGDDRCIRLSFARGTKRLTLAMDRIEAFVASLSPS